MPCGNPDFLAKLVHCCEFDLIERESAEKGAREKASGFVEGLGSTFSLAGAASPERSSLELLFPGDETGKAVLTSLLQGGSVEVADYELRSCSTLDSAHVPRLWAIYHLVLA